MLRRRASACGLLLLVPAVAGCSSWSTSMTGPAAYFRLLKTVNEATQIFGTPPPGFRPPQGLTGLGPFASWFPNNRQLMATDNVDLLTATVTWPGARARTEIAVARAAVAPYLVHHRPGAAKDYP